MMSEILARKDKINSAIDRLDPALFVEGLVGWLEATVFLQVRAAELRSGLKSIAASDTAMPTLSDGDLLEASVQQIADDTIFAFCVSAALRKNKTAIPALEAALTKRYDQTFIGSVALGSWREEIETGNALDDAAGRIIKAMLEDRALDAKDVLTAGFRLFEWARKSNFVQELIPTLAQWLRGEWAQIIVEQRFHLVRPRLCVPAIEEVLTVIQNDQAFIAALLLEGAGAVDVEIEPAYRDQMRVIAQRS